jgi:hypothetical protein
MFGLHVEASRRRNELLEECQRLMEAGQRGAAKRCLAAAEEIQELLTAPVDGGEAGAVSERTVAARAAERQG